MNTPTTLLAGNVARSTVTFTPDSGTVSLADVTARVWDGSTTTTLTPVQDSTNIFHADVTIADSAGDGTWYVRWESNSPSPKISAEVAFRVLKSNIANP